MPILFVHGVAIRVANSPEWAALQHLTHGIDWPHIEAQLRTHVAAVLNPAQPDAVDIALLFWGDLGAEYVPSEPVHRDVTPPRPRHPRLDQLSDAEFGEWTERRLCVLAPLDAWPALVVAVWDTVRDSGVRAVLSLTAPSGQWPVLQAAVQTRLDLDAEPDTFWPHLLDQAELRQRWNVKRAMTRLRRPLEAVMPVFVGDVMCYLSRRGTPARPGPIARRVMDGLLAAHESRQDTGEPLVVLTHSMGDNWCMTPSPPFCPPCRP